MKRTSKAPLLWKIGKPSSQENLIMTPLYKHPLGGGGYFLIWAIRRRAAGQGMVCWPRCPKQGVQFDLALS